MIKLCRIVTRRKVYNKELCKDTEYKDSRLWVSKHGGATFTEGVNALSVIQGVQQSEHLDFPGGPLCEVETGLVQKVGRIPNSGGGLLRVNR